MNFITIHISSQPSNTHHTQTHSKSGVFKPKVLPVLFLTLVEPKSTKATIQDPKWVTFMNDEFSAL